MQNKSLGLIETWGHIPAVEAADAGCKAANVMLTGYEEVRAGLVTITFTGDVAAVKTAVTAGTLAAQRVGKVVSTHVIARPDQQVQRLSRPPAGGPPPAPPSAPQPPPPTAPPPSENSGSSPPQDRPIVEDETVQPQASAAPVATEAPSEGASSAAESNKTSKTRRKKKA